MSLTSYRAAPPRAIAPTEWCGMPRGFLAIGGIVLERGVSFQVWRRPTLPRLETQYHWRRHTYRPSSGWDREFCARYDHQTGEETGERRSPDISVVPGFRLRAFDDPLRRRLRYGAPVFALLFPDQIKPIGRLVPVS